MRALLKLEALAKPVVFLVFLLAACGGNIPQTEQNGDSGQESRYELVPNHIELQAGERGFVHILDNDELLQRPATWSLLEAPSDLSVFRSSAASEHSVSVRTHYFAEPGEREFTLGVNAYGTKEELVGRVTVVPRADSLDVNVWGIDYDRGLGRISISVVRQGNIAAPVVIGLSPVDGLDLPREFVAPPGFSEYRTVLEVPVAENFKTGELLEFTATDGNLVQEGSTELSLVDVTPSFDLDARVILTVEGEGFVNLFTGHSDEHRSWTTSIGFDELPIKTSWFSTYPVGSMVSVSQAKDVVMSLSQEGHSCDHWQNGTSSSGERTIYWRCVKNGP